MKTKILILVLLLFWFCSCDDDFIIESYSESELSVSVASTQHSYNGFTAGAGIIAKRQNGHNSVEATIYAQSESVDSVHLTNENNQLDTIVSLPYSETFKNNDVLLNDRYEYVFSWKQGNVTKSILIDYVVLLQNSHITVECHSVIAQ